MRNRLVVVAAVVMLAAAPVRSSRGDPGAESEHEIRAPQRLAETGLYVSTHPGVIDDRNRPFTPQYPLWSDGAAKARWIYLPLGASIDVSNANDWEFPVGTRFWKEFTFNGRKVETRLLWKAADTRWIAASYVWNAEQTDAVLAPEHGLAGVAEIGNGRRHSIPSAIECTACHGARRTRPLGFTALQLSPDRDPNAIHGEPLAADMVTLRTLVDERLLSPARTELVTSPPRIATANPRTRAVLGYLSTNCGSCHDGEGEIAALGPVIKIRDLLQDGDAVARNFIDHRTRWAVPGVAENASVLANPHAVDESAMLVRMRSRRPSSQMPPLGTAVRDQAAVDAIARWIAVDLAVMR